jgi:hypothetical protein
MIEFHGFILTFIDELAPGKPERILGDRLALPRGTLGFLD